MARSEKALCGSRRFFSLPFSSPPWPLRWSSPSLVAARLRAARLWVAVPQHVLLVTVRPKKKKSKEKKKGWKGPRDVLRDWSRTPGALSSSRFVASLLLKARVFFRRDVLGWPRRPGLFRLVVALVPRLTWLFSYKFHSEMTDREENVYMAKLAEQVRNNALCVKRPFD
jgi:hypothetical protein